jgi:hypothetical protein
MSGQASGEFRECNVALFDLSAQGHIQQAGPMRCAHLLETGERLCPQGRPAQPSMSLSELKAGVRDQVLLGATNRQDLHRGQPRGAVNRPALVLAPNKTLRPSSSMSQGLVPPNLSNISSAITILYHQKPTCSIRTTYIEKDSSINDEHRQAAHAAPHALLPVATAHRGLRVSSQAWEVPSTMQR